MTDLLTLVPSDTVVPTLRTLDKQPLTVADLVEYMVNDWRVYDADCPFDFSHTWYWCGHSRCPVR